MTNYPFSSLEELRDVQSINQFEEMKSKGEVQDFEEVREYVRFWSRDNARTPMQWNSGENGGFTEGEPWINVNPNKDRINVENEKTKENSVLNFYRKLISLRKEHEVLVYGKYRLILGEDENIFAFLREGSEETSLTVLNFSNEESIFNPGKELNHDTGELLLANYSMDEPEEAAPSTLRPYEARLYLLD